MDRKLYYFVQRYAAAADNVLDCELLPSRQVNVLAPFLLTKALLPIVVKVRLSKELLSLCGMAQTSYHPVHQGARHMNQSLAIFRRCAARGSITSIACCAWPGCSACTQAQHAIASIQG
jgi:hypothetical protein